MYSNKIIIYFSFLILFSCDMRTAKDYLDIAYDLETQEKYEKAILYLDKAIEKKPNFRPALLNRGADKSMLENYIGAIEDYKLLLRYDPDNTMALMNIGNSYKSLNKNEVAIDYYNKALETSGAISSDSIYINIYDDWDRDEDYYVRENEIKLERGISYEKLGKCNLAIKDLEESFKYTSQNVQNRVLCADWLSNAYLSCKDTLSFLKYRQISDNHQIFNTDRLKN